MCVTLPFSLMNRRRWRLKIALWMFMVAPLSLLFFQQTEFSGSTIRHQPAGSITPGPGCDRVYRLSSVFHRMELGWPAGGAGCAVPMLTPPLLRRCVAERARRRRRPTSILLLGDSRMRMLYQHLAEQLGVPTPAEHTQRYPGWQKGVRWDNSPQRWCRVCPWHCCPRAATDGSLSLRFEWRPVWTEAMVAEVEAAAERCERGQDDCPDLVLLNGAMWYIKATLLVNAWKDGVTELVLLLRLQLARASKALARLASLTRTIWKVDEGMPYDVHRHLHSPGPAEIPIAHSLLYDAARKIPGLTLWSSALPESTEFLRRRCYAMQSREDPGGLDDEESPEAPSGRIAPPKLTVSNETFIYECGKESLHASKAVMSKAIQMTFSELCSTDLDLPALNPDHSNEDFPIQLPLCCTENT